MSPPEDKEKAASEDAGELMNSDGIDMVTFSQILEMDEPGDSEFSTSIVFGFFDQAEETFSTMEQALEDKDLDNLSSLGHFLKGSSATLGLIKVRDGCESIQRYGKRENDDGSPLEDNDDEIIEKIRKVVKQVKEDYAAVEEELRDYYDKLGATN